MKDATTERIARFSELLNVYSELSRPHHNQLELFLDEVTLQITAWRERLYSRREPTSPDFNVFAIIKRGHFETTTHSAMLAALLDPMGPHEQGGLFLEAFLIRFKRIWESKKPSIQWDMPAADSHWKVFVEYAIKGQRRVDILLHHPSENRWLAIENKIYAKDQSRQLLDYWAWVVERDTGASHPIVYLTVDGTEPTKVSTEDNTDLLNDLICMSYHGDITDILKSVRHDIHSERVCHTIDQYLQTLEAL